MKDKFNMVQYRSQGAWLLVASVCLVALGAIAIISNSMPDTDTPEGWILAIMALLCLCGLGVSCFMLDAASGERE